MLARRDSLTFSAWHPILSMRHPRSRSCVTLQHVVIPFDLGKCRNMIRLQ